jgi:hypothetical protein
MCVLCVVYVINTQKRAAPKLCSRMPQQPGRAGGRAASGQAGPEPEPGRGPGTRPGPGQLHTCHTPGLAAALAWNGRARPSGRRLPGISPARLATAGPLACAIPTLHRERSGLTTRRHVDASLDFFTRKSPRSWRDLSEKRAFSARRLFFVGGVGV